MPAVSETASNEKRQAIMAICYDFDRTLTPEEMQAQGFIQSLQEKVSDFWESSNKLAYDNSMDNNLAYMYLMLKGAENKFYVKRDELVEAGSKVKLFNGVDTWFDRIDAYAAKKGVTVEHYIISSGLREMIEGTSIAGKFKKIYANSFLYNESGVAIWPAQIINFTNKTQFLFRIEKGALDVNDDNVNTYYSAENMRIPFRNMVYIGDSNTDIPCMKLVNSFGGYSIGVFDPVSNDKSKVYSLIRDRRIKFFSPADYSEGSDLELLLKNIVNNVATTEVLQRKYEAFCRESKDFLEKKAE